MIKKKYLLYYILAIALIGVFIILIANNKPSALYHPECYREGGTWKTFPNSCVDICGAVACYEAFTAGCDCGMLKCWNGSSCMLNP